MGGRLGARLRQQGSQEPADVSRWPRDAREGKRARPARDARRSGDARLRSHAAARTRGPRFLVAVERLAAGLRFFLGWKAAESSLASSARHLWCR